MRGAFKDDLLDKIGDATFPRILVERANIDEAIYGQDVIGSNGFENDDHAIIKSVHFDFS